MVKLTLFCDAEFIFTSLCHNEQTLKRVQGDELMVLILNDESSSLALCDTVVRFILNTVINYDF